MRVDIASSCKSLWGNFQLGCTKTRRETNSLMVLLITIGDNARPAVIVIFSEQIS